MADINFQASVAYAGVQVDTENARTRKARELRAERELLGEVLTDRQIPVEDTVSLSRPEPE